MRAFHEVRYAGEKIRVFSVHFGHGAGVSVRTAWGTANEQVTEVVRKYGQREAMLILPKQERWVMDVLEAAALELRTVWRKSAAKAGLTETYQIKEG